MIHVLPDLDVFGPEIVVAGFTLWLIWEVYAPQFGINTALAPIMELPDRMEVVEEKADETRTKMDGMEEKQLHHIQVTRANSRALDRNRNGEIDSNQVDEYLVDNGITIDSLMHETEETESDE